MNGRPFRNYDRLVWLAKLLRAVEFRVLVALRGVGIGRRRGRGMRGECEFKFGASLEGRRTTATIPFLFSCMYTF